MHIVMKCPCGAKLKAPEKLIGREISCPKCSTKLMVPKPPIAAPVVPVAELVETIESEPQVLDPLLDPLAAPVPPLARPPMAKPGMQQPAYASAPPRRPSTAKPKKDVSYLRLGLIAATLFAIAGGVLFFIYKDAGQSESNTGSAVYVEGKKVNLGSGKKKLDSKFTDFKEPVERKKVPNNVKNEHDSGNKKIDVGSRKGSDTDLELSDLTDKVDPSIVRIKVETVQGEKVGSGFFIDTEGKIVTNYHVVQGAHNITVETVDKKEFKVIGHCGADADRDLAIIQIDPEGSKGVPISLPASQPRKGEKVASFGSPQGFGFTATLGNISSIRSGKEISGILNEMTSVDLYKRLGYTTDMNWVQTTTPISGGNSGGPLVNMRGELIGVNTWTHPGGQNLNFASNMEEVLKLYESRDGELYRIHLLHPKIDVAREREGGPEDGLGF